MTEKAKKITLDDIAAETKLSKFSVSRAIAGKSGVSKETRKQVLDACERLGYVRKKAQNSGGGGSGRDTVCRIQEPVFCGKGSGL